MFKTVFLAAALISATAGIARAGEGSGEPFPFHAGAFSTTTTADPSPAVTTRQATPYAMRTAPRMTVDAGGRPVSRTTR